MTEKGLSWKQWVYIYTDGALSMVGKTHFFFAHIKATAPECTSSFCAIHRPSLAVKKNPKALKTVLDEAVNIASVFNAPFTKWVAVTHRCTRKFCYSMLTIPSSFHHICPEVSIPSRHVYKGKLTKSFIPRYNCDNYLGACNNLVPLIQNRVFKVTR
jgi:hypothetical protein